MNHYITGNTIRVLREKKQITQKELAQILGVSDKTISKWECGKGLPEVSLMLPLCDALHITVNDLLSGERLSDTEYQERAEKNMVDLIKENEENKKRMLLSIICGVITVIACCSLIVITSFLPLPTAVRIALILFTIVTAVAGIGAAAVLEVKAGYYECPYCGALFVPTMADYIKGYHTLTKRRLPCPQCGKTGMCRHRIVR